MTESTLVRGRQVPPTCPKCGSHRTQIIGTYGGDANTLNIRCGSCGEVSAVPVPKADGPNTSSATESAERFEEELQPAVAVAVPR